MFPPDREDNLDEVIKMMIGAKIHKNPYGKNVVQNILEIMKNELIKEMGDTTFSNKDNLLGLLHQSENTDGLN